MKLPLGRRLLHFAAGYRRPFENLQEASDFASRFLPGHETQDNLDNHLAMAQKPRISDYPVLFHLRACLEEVQTLLDFGGNIGNLFYCYSRYLDIPKRLKWLVYDLPGTIAAGRALAQTRSESQLEFTSTLITTDRIDFLLVSGSLHYFEEPLSALIARLSAKPRHIVINRTPLTQSGSTVTVQDGESHLAACKVISVGAVKGDLETIGYTLVDSWDAPERSLKIPFHPEFSVPSYTGMYWRLAERQSTG